jgi:hypothetical protein
LAALPETYDNVETLNGRGTMIRNGYLPERKVVSVIGPVTVMVPKVRDRSGPGVKFNSHFVPPYIRKSARASAGVALAVSAWRLDRRHHRGRNAAARVMQVARRLAESGETVRGKPGKAYD